MKIWDIQAIHSVVYDLTKTPQMLYNHDSDITRFKDRYICLWNANEKSIYEHKPGQMNYSSVSDDFINWSKPVKCFTEQANAVNPQKEDTQWQPTFINYHNNRLFCNWQGRIRGKPAHFVSYSDDGLKWTNTVQSTAPEGMKDVYAFPTQHGLLTSKDILVFPISLCNEKEFWKTKHAAVLISYDKGKSWQWSEPVEAVKWSQIGQDCSTFKGDDHIKLWEPTVFERSDGNIGMLIRNLTKKEWNIRSEHMMLYAESKDDGKTWSKAVPVDVETVSSRVMAAQRKNTDGLFVIANDWYANYPEFVEDRQFLSLLVSPISDPDFLLPGPTVQLSGDTAHYPNGEIINNDFIYSYSFGNMPRYINAGIIKSLPDFSEPFLMPRQRLAKPLVYANEIIFQQSYSSMPLVLTKKLTQKSPVSLTFSIKPMRFCRYSRRMPIITIGGKSKNGMTIYMGNEMKIFTDTTDGQTIEIGDLGYNFSKWINFNIILKDDNCSIVVQDVGSYKIDQKLTKKICFGGLYERPTAWPTGSSFILDKNSITVG
jgi:hypothetical protein